MSRLLSFLLISAVLLAGCDRPASSDRSGLPTVKLNDAIGDQIGGPSTCVVILDAASGAVRYQYGMPSVCSRPLPPCATFDIANALIGLDTGLIASGTVFKWDGSPQPVSAWQRDADLDAAFKPSIGWWNTALATRIGPAVYAQKLKAYDYGSAAPDGPIGQFWMGPAVGGGLAISTRQQAGFLQRLYAGKLPVQPQTSQVVQGLLASESRGPATFHGKAGSCDSISDASRSVGWSVGRLVSPGDDLVFAASIEGQNAFPGSEMESRIKAAFANAGLWPAG